MVRTIFCVCLSCIISILSISSLSLAQDGGKGKITGTVIDGSTGEEMVGAVVKLDGTKLGAICDTEGKYAVSNIPPGKYTIIAVMVGYSETRITDVTVVSGKTVTLDMKINPEEVEIEEIKVKAKAIRNTDEALIQERKEEKAVSDAISAESITRAGSGNAAEAAKQITGTTVVDGKSVYVRGLGDRYTNVQLNGSELPSTSQYNQTVQIDLFPSNLLDNIVALKTYTPDKPGAFTGGSINILTKSFPEKMSLNFSASTAYLQHTTFSNEFLTYTGGSKDWLGYDDGTRDVPEILKNSNVKEVDIGHASHDIELARKLDAYSKAFTTTMSPTKGYAPLNQNYSLTFGNQISLLNRPFGFLGSLNYNRSFASYKDGISARWNLTSPTADKLDDYMNLKDAKSTDDVLWGGLVNFAYDLSDNHKIRLNYFHSQNGESYARVLSGTYGENISENATFVPSVIGYNERALNSIQLNGQHTLNSLHDIKIEWRSSFARLKENEPDLRYFSYIYSDNVRNERSYIVFSNFYDGPTHYFRKLAEDNNENGIDISIPFKQWSGKESTFKFGGTYSSKSRSFNENQFVFDRDKYIAFTGDTKTFFSNENIGLIDSTRTPYKFGLYVVDLSGTASLYDGDQIIRALYGMIDIPLTTKFRFISGARYETTYQKVANPDTSGVIEINDYLPSVNLIYQPSEKMNIRSAFSRTLARPTIREMAPYTSFDYAAGNFFIGNPELKRTLIDNFDIRWEWFPNINDVYSISAFIKNFNDPIERVIKNYNGEITFQNVNKAFVRGLEFEARRSLTPYFRNVRVGGNLSIIDSWVRISDDEMLIIHAYDPHASNKREFMGQSPYIINLDALYHNDKRGLELSLYYNKYGKRLVANSLGGTPDVYQKPISMINATIVKIISQNLSLKIVGKNLLASQVVNIQTYKGKEFVASEYDTGRSYSVGLSYSL